MAPYSYTYSYTPISPGGAPIKQFWTIADVPILRMTLFSYHAPCT